MQKLKPQTRFLLRGSALLIGLLTLWWFVMLNPLLSTLEAAGGMLGALVLGGRSGELIHENPSGDWSFRVPLEKTIPATAGQPAQQLHSIDFDMPRSVSPRSLISSQYSAQLPSRCACIARS